MFLYIQFSVLDSARGCGVASKLLKHIHLMADSKKIDTCLETTIAMPAAIQLYNKVGYEVYQTVRYVDDSMPYIDRLILKYIFYIQGIYFYRRCHKH